MSRLLGPEESKGELEGGLELEEVAEQLEGRETSGSEGFDLIYDKDGRASNSREGSVYSLKESGSDWYKEDELDNIEIGGLEIDVQQIKMNAVTGETVLVDSSGDETRYDIFSSYEGTTTFTQEVGRNEYVFRYNKQTDEVKAIEIGGDMSASEWGSEKLQKRAELMDKIYHETRKSLWHKKASEDRIETKNSNFDQLKPVYNKVRNDMEKSEQDRAVIEKSDHIGSTRGIDIMMDFKKAVRRAPEDSIDNYKIPESKSYPLILEKIR